MHWTVTGKEAKICHGRGTLTCNQLRDVLLIRNQGYPEDLVVSVALGADMFDCVWPTRTAVSHPETPSLYPVNISIALWQRHHLRRRPQPQECSILRRLRVHRRGLPMHMLSAHHRWRPRHHSRIYLPRHGEGNCWSPSADHAQRSLSTELDAFGQRSHSRRSISTVSERLLQEAV